MRQVRVHRATLQNTRTWCELCAHLCRHIHQHRQRPLRGMWQPLRTDGHCLAKLDDRQVMKPTPRCMHAKHAQAYVSSRQHNPAQRDISDGSFGRAITPQRAMHTCNAALRFHPTCHRINHRCPQTACMQLHKATYRLCTMIYKLCGESPTRRV
jgi:hypothetical protein